MGLFGERKKIQNVQISLQQKRELFKRIILNVYTEEKNKGSDEALECALFVALNIVYRESDRLSNNPFYLATKNDNITSSLFMEAGVSPFYTMLNHLEPDSIVEFFIDYLMLIDGALDTNKYYNLKKVINLICLKEAPSSWAIAKTYEHVWFKLLDPEIVEHLIDGMYK